MGTPKRWRLAFLNTHPIQYFAPLYAYLNTDPEIDVTGIYLSDYSTRGAMDQNFGRVVRWDVDLLAGYTPLFAPGADRRGEPRGFFSLVGPELWSVLRRERFDALIVHGHTPAAMLVAVAAAKSCGTKVFLRGETHLGLNRSRLKSALRRPLLKALYQAIDGVFAIGEANADFYRAMGVEDHRIFSMPYTVDNARFMRDATLDLETRVAVRSVLAPGAAHEAALILYSAKFQERKRPLDLVRAFAQLGDRIPAPHLVLIGSGALEGELRALTQQLKLKTVHFHGFVNQQSMPQMYAACDIFALPSVQEPWGLAVNEAMCAKLPIVVSEEVGCVRDLVANGRNGITFQGGDVNSLSTALGTLVDNPALRQEMGGASQSRVVAWSYRECLAGLRAALDALSAAHGIARTA